MDRLLGNTIVLVREFAISFGLSALPDMHTPQLSCPESPLRCHSKGTVGVREGVESRRLSRDLNTTTRPQIHANFPAGATPGGVGPLKGRATNLHEFCRPSTLSRTAVCPLGNRERGTDNSRFRGVKGGATLARCPSGGSRHAALAPCAVAGLRATLVAPPAGCRPRRFAGVPLRVPLSCRVARSGAGLGGGAVRAGGGIGLRARSLCGTCLS